MRSCFVFFLLFLPSLWAVRAVNQPNQKFPPKIKQNNNKKNTRRFIFIPLSLSLSLFFPPSTIAEILPISFIFLCNFRSLYKQASPRKKNYLGRKEKSLFFFLFAKKNTTTTNTKESRPRHQSKSNGKDF